MPFINKPDSSRDLTIFMTTFMSSFEIINLVIPDPNIFFANSCTFFLRIAASVADAAAVNPISIKTVLANDFSTFFH